MRRVMVLALLALALPTAALANTISFGAGPCLCDASGVVSGESFGGGLVGFVFAPYDFVISGTGTPTGTDSLAITGGTLIVTYNALGPDFCANMGLNPAACAPGTTAFQASIASGSASVTDLSMLGSFHTCCIFTASGSLEPNARIKNGFFDFVFSTDVEVQSSAIVFATTVPEPSTLEGLLLGTGMLGLAEMTRRKLRLGT